MPRRWVHFFALLVGAVWGASALPANAQGSAREHAAELKKKGDDAYDAMRYAEALEAYNQSYQAHPDPRVLYNRGRAYAAMSRYPEALRELEAFKSGASKQVLGKVPQLDTLIAEVGGKVSTLRLNTSVKGARVVLRNEVIGETPMAPKRVNAGRARLEVTAEGRLPFKKTIDLRGASETVIEVDLPPLDSQARLVVSSPVAGARVKVDGRSIGVVPAETQVDPGEHLISVTHDGYSDAETRTFVKAGEAKSLSIPLDKSGSITSKWWFWTGVGVVVVGAVVTIVALNTEKPADKGDIAPGQVAVPLLSF